MQVQFFKHASFRVQRDTGQQIYLDPWELPQGLPEGELILVTHDHRDHCSPEDIKPLMGANTLVVGPASVQEKLAEAGITVHLVDAGQYTEVAGCGIRAVEAYNTSKLRPSGEPFHPREKGYVGYVLGADGKRIYFAGDTDVVPQDVERDGPVDLALVPVSGKAVMTAQEAAEQLRGRPFQSAIPMHYGALMGSRDDAEAFHRQAACEVLILEEGETRTLS